MGNFYNTIGLQGKDLFSSQQRVKKQEDIILQIFAEDGEEMTPFEVSRVLQQQGYDYPITSIRRAITDLTRDGKLEKTLTRRDGGYGQKNYTWKIR